MRHWLVFLFTWTSRFSQWLIPPNTASKYDQWPHHPALHIFTCIGWRTWRYRSWPFWSLNAPRDGSTHLVDELHYSRPNVEARRHLRYRIPNELSVLGWILNSTHSLALLHHHRLSFAAPAFQPSTKELFRSLFLGCGTHSTQPQNFTSAPSLIVFGDAWRLVSSIAVSPNFL